MAQDLFNNDVHVNGALSCKTLNPPASSITNTAIIAGAGIEATKVVHQFALEYTQPGGTAVVNATQLLHILRAGGEVVSIEAFVTTVATGADRTVTIDLQKSTAAGAFATILTSGLVLNNASVVRTVYSGAIASPTLIDNDLLQLVVTVAGAAGNQAQGLQVTVTLRENPQ